MDRIVVIGGGQAAASLVQRLRAKGHEGEITLLAGEPVPPYQRPPLSKAYLLGEMARERLFLKPAEWYAANGVMLMTGSTATAIDRDAKTVTACGEALPYDALVLATGARPRRLPAEIGGELPGVHVVRTLADIDALAPAMEAGAKALIVGGGYIGLEAAAVARKLGLEVTILEAAERILGRVAARETADWFRALHRSHGVDVREKTGLTRLEGNDRVERAVLADGTALDVDVVIAGIGILPEDGLARAAGLTVENGIAVDAHGRTSDPAIFAAGDCASFTWRGGRLRLESVQNAIDMGEAVADVLTGSEAPYDPKPWFWSDQYDVKLQIAGLGAGHDRIVIREGTSRSHWYYREGHLIALDAMNDARAYMVGKRLIEAGKSPDPDAVADPETDLKALLRA